MTTCNQLTNSTSISKLTSDFGVMWYALKNLFIERELGTYQTGVAQSMSIKCVNLIIARAALITNSVLF